MLQMNWSANTGRHELTHGGQKGATHSAETERTSLSSFHIFGHCHHSSLHPSVLPVLSVAIISLSLTNETRLLLSLCLLAVDVFIYSVSDPVLDKEQLVVLLTKILMRHYAHLYFTQHFSNLKALTWIFSLRWKQQTRQQKMMNTSFEAILGIRFRKLIQLLRDYWE